MSKTSTTVLWVIVVLLVLAGLYFAFFYNQPPAPLEPVGNIPPGTICTMDARQCSDGSYVGRSGPNCQFVCPAGTTLGSPAPVVNGNVNADGTVTASPADVGK